MMFRKVSLLVTFALGLSLLLEACGTPSPAPSSLEGGIKVMVSIVPQEYFVERIGGDKVSVSVMVPPGFSPATYEPKPSQIEELSMARVYIRIRVPFEEAWMERIAAANEDMLIVDQSEGIERIGGTDPHIWLSPRLVKIQAQTIYDGLVEIDPNNERFYGANLDAFLADLDELDTSIREKLFGLESRKFMVFHPAWPYFAWDYELEMVPIEIEGSEPSVAEMAELIRTARESDIKVIFAQPEFSTERAETIAEEIGGEVLLISPLAPDWLDNLQRVADTFAEVLAEQR
jgi:zinc transport system substrate-binding protein